MKKFAVNRYNPRNAGAARFSSQPKPCGISNAWVNIYPGKMNCVDWNQDFKDQQLGLKATSLARGRRNNLLSNFAPSTRFSQPVPNLRNALAM
jgi:hypothetical protein